MKSFKNIRSLALAILLLVASCKKDDTTAPASPKTGSIEMHYGNRVDTNDLVLNTQWYKNENGDSFKVSTFNYYISNIVFNGPSNTSYKETESYHLVQANTMSSTAFTISGITPGKYSSVSFLIGVDSTRNVSGAQTGALDPALGMFWSWNTGYIFMKMEGQSPKSTATGNSLQFHIGGFSGANNTIRTITIPFNDTITIDNNAYHAHINVDLAQLFKAPNRIDFSVLNTVHMPGANAVKIADNYASMFSLEEIVMK
jgi:hypothetical protein